MNFYYFAMYQNKIDIFIFGLKDDNTQALLEIILKDYPIFLILAGAFIFAGLCFWLNLRLLRLNLKPLKLKRITYVILNLCLIVLYILALRGPYKHVSMRADNYRFSQVSLINDISINPFMALSWALKQYQNEENINFISDSEGEALQERLFTLYQTSPKNELAAQIKPHVVLNIMESFGLGVLEYQSENLNLLGVLKTHFESDYLFTRFLSSENGTMPSFASLIYLSPKPFLAQSKYQHLRLKDTPIDVYKKAGYEVIFVYAGNGAWQNVGAFMKTQGVDKIFDEITLMSEYKGAKESANGYGIADGFMYEKIYSLLKEAIKPTLIIALSISNHPPYSKTPYALLDESAVPKDLLAKIYSPKTSNALEILQAYAYANNEFGKFLSRIKQDLNLNQKTIIAATGDHRQREFEADLSTQKALAYSVPFYLYVPKTLRQGLYYDKTRLGSHKDIFATLYALSLSEVRFLSLGGQNMFTQDKAREFGYNAQIYIDSKGVYPLGSQMGFLYESNASLKNLPQGFELDETHLNFAKDYQRLDAYQLGVRLKEALGR